MPKLRPGAAKGGDTIRFHYNVKFSTGFIVNSTKEGPPAEMVLGKGLAVPGLEKAIKGMLPGESKTITVKCENAFGQRQENLMIPVPRSQFPNQQFALGQAIEFTQPNGEVVNGKVRFVDELTVFFDLNHPLAGHDLTYDIELIEIVARGESGGKRERG